MIDIKTAHPYVIALYHSILSEIDNWTEIQNELYKQYPTDTLIQLENDVDRAYILKRTNGEIIVAISGTKSLQGWVRNFKCEIHHGFHHGFRESFTNLIRDPLVSALDTHKGKVWIYGHSAGSALSLDTSYFLRTSFQRDCEAITFCGPQAVTKMGKKACVNAKVCMTTLNIGNHDFVDDIGKIIGGLNYGKIVMLPDIGDPGINRSLILDKIFFGHAPSYVCKSLKVLMQRYRKPQDEYIDYILPFAKI